MKDDTDLSCTMDLTKWESNTQTCVVAFPPPILELNFYSIYTLHPWIRIVGIQSKLGLHNDGSASKSDRHLIRSSRILNRSVIGHGLIVIAIQYFLEGEDEDI